MSIILQEPIPNFNFRATSDLSGNLADFQGRWITLYFYPKDDTPGCTIESRDFRDSYEDFQALNTIILGVSRDSLLSHEKFKNKHQLPFELISDEDEVLCQLFEVIKMKSMYGKKMRGIERSTFLIDPQGILREMWRRVKVIGHIEAIKKTLQTMQSGA